MERAALAVRQSLAGTCGAADARGKLALAWLLPALTTKIARMGYPALTRAKRG